MAKRSDIAFTSAVKRAQELRGSRESYERIVAHADWSGTITPELADFVARRDSVYLGTATADGQPYIQHRGGPTGFVKILDERHLALADYAGNRQYISLGNLSENPKAFMFLMDYPNRIRMKIWGTARFVEDDAALFERVRDPDYPAQVQRVLVFEVLAWDRNCPRHIRPRLTEQELEDIDRQAP